MVGCLQRCRVDRITRRGDRKRVSYRARGTDDTRRRRVVKPHRDRGDLYHEQVADPDARWVADLDGDFITSETATPKRTYLYPVSGVLTFSGTDHHLVVAMAEPKGIHAFEQSGGASSLLDAIRSADVEPADQEMVDGRELTVLGVAEPVEMSAFGEVDLSRDPRAATSRSWSTHPVGPSSCG